MPLRPLAATVVAVLAAAPVAGAQTLEDIALQRRLPAAYRTTCAVVPAEVRTPGALAAVHCGPEVTGGVDARYESYPSHVTAGDRYKTILLTSPAGLRLDFGDCTTAGPSEYPWLAGGRPSGRLACFNGAAGATMVWTHAASGIVAVASRADGDTGALNAWWTDAGPLSEVVDSRLLAVGGLFPDPYEVGVLAAMPPAVARTCFREKLSRTRALLQASLICSGPPGRVAGVVYRRFATKALVEREYARDLRNAGLRRGIGGVCGGPSPAEGTWTRNGRVRGRLACATVRGTARVFWFERDLRLEVFAYSRGGDLRRVHRWWRRNA